MSRAAVRRHHRIDTAIALLKLLLGFVLAPQAGQRETAIVARALIRGVGFFGAGEELFGEGIVLVAKSKLAETCERTGMIGIAGEDALKERFGFVVVMGFESELAKLIVGLGLLGCRRMEASNSRRASSERSSAA